MRHADDAQRRLLQMRKLRRDFRLQLAAIAAATAAGAHLGLKAPGNSNRELPEKPI
jgi:hypothetical protein